MKRLLQWLIDDERLKPREIREIHPIVEEFPSDVTYEVFDLKCKMARLWDQVWWVSLPWYRRLVFRLLGFRAPISRFYLKPGENWK